MSVPLTFGAESHDRPALPGSIPARLSAHAPGKKLHSVSLDARVQATVLSNYSWKGLQRLATHSLAQDSGKNVLIVGAGRLGRELEATLKCEHAQARRLVGFLDESAPIEGDVLGRVEDLSRIARFEFVDEVILAIPYQQELAQRAIREARRNRLNIRVIPDPYVHGHGPVALQYFGDLPILTLYEEKIPKSALFWKRVIDIAFSALALFLSAPLMAIIALAIKVASPGPVLYRAKRVGLKGRGFLCHKFRTMVTNADGLKDGLRERNERTGPCFKIAADPRITSLGRYLRRYSLDELPQLWNVLRGEMSLVGPRPHPLDDFKHYRLDHFRRLDVTPGFTGLWQVTARRDPSFQRNMALDLEYIEHWNLRMDLRILWKTLFVMLQGSGG